MTRSQLDCYHHYLPGNGTFDIKTRATIAIRHDRLNHAVCHIPYFFSVSKSFVESFVGVVAVWSKRMLLGIKYALHKALWNLSKGNI